MSQPPKKRHHYIPVTYLNGFVDPNAKIHAFKKSPPQTVLHIRPQEIGFEKYYYSQKREDGTFDNDTLENAFQTSEQDWPQIVRSLTAREARPDIVRALFLFVTLMRVRVPAIRDMVELGRAAEVKHLMRQMEASGKLPPRPPAIKNLDQINVSIDPHQSLLAMASLAEGFEKLFKLIGFEIVHNNTDTPFITSDNPVAHFDPDISLNKIQPYKVRPPFGKIELLFPISSRIALRGHSDMIFDFIKQGLGHRTCDDHREIARINRISSMFSYGFVFYGNPKMAAVAKRYKDSSPVIEITSNSVSNDEGRLLMRYRFGPRIIKEKWKRKPPPNMSDK